MAPAESGRGYAFSAPDTEQGDNVVSAMIELMDERLIGTSAETLFSGMDDATRLYHVRQLSGALIAAANEELTPEMVTWLAKRHQEVRISGEQFDIVTAAVTDILVEYDEEDLVDAIQPFMPELRIAFVSER